MSFFDCLRLVPCFRYLRCGDGNGLIHLFINFRRRHMLMLFVKRLGNLDCEDRLIFGEVRYDRRRRRLLRCCRLGRRSRALTLTLRLVLILRDRFARKNDGLVSRRRSVIVVATDASGRRWALESRVRRAAAGTVVAAKTFVP